MGGVFISYRAEDSQSYGALIYSELSRQFGADQVFLDSESTPAGEDFAAVLLGRLRKCSVLLAVIGPRWLTATDAAGRRRIDSPEDWIRRELAEAFAHGLRVIPILTEGVQVPSAADLPADIATLHRRQCLRVHHRNTSHDIARIVEELTRLDQGLAQAAQRRGGVPRQLPCVPPLFIGRAREVARLTSALVAAGEKGATVVISAIGGVGGIGKTALAVQWAHRNIERFPDGQLYVDLRGFDLARTPMAPADAVRGFLDVFGVEPDAIPADLDAKVGLYRSLVAGKRILIVLDNACDSAQVSQLLPGDPKCTVMVTSRHQLTGLVTRHGAQLLDLDALSEAEARELLSRHLGHDRVAAEPETVTELLERCAGLPLAVGIMAARVATHPHFPLSVLAGELREASTRLDALDAGELSVNLRAVFASSYQALSAEATEVFGLLGLVSGPDIGLLAVAGLAAQPVARTRSLLRELEAAYLVQQHAPGRYRMHDLIHLYANERACHDLRAVTRETALRRLVDFYLHSAYRGERLLQPSRRPIEIGRPAFGCVPHSMEDGTAAMAWFNTEHPCVLAAQQLATQQAQHQLVWQLAWTLDTFHFRRGHLHDNLAAWRAGLAAAEQLDDPAACALARQNLGHACAWAGWHTEALDHLTQALHLAEQIGDAHSQATTHRALAQAWEQQGDNQQALTHANHSLRIYQTLDNPVWEAVGLNLAGWCHARLGHQQQARTCCEAALALFHNHHHRDGEAATLDSLGYLAQHSGQHAHAISYYRRALSLYRDLGNTYDEADTLARLGEVHTADDQGGEARQAWQQAVELYQSQHRMAEAERVQRQIAALS